MIHACTDLSDGGLALAAFELSEAAGVGITLDADDTPTLFGEDQARYLIACNVEMADALMVAAGAANVALAMVGRVGGDQVSFGHYHAPLAALATTFRSTFEDAVA